MLEFSKQKAEDLLIKYCGQLSNISKKYNIPEIDNAVNALQLISGDLQKSQKNIGNPQKFLNKFIKEFELDLTIIDDQKQIDTFNNFMNELKNPSPTRDQYNWSDSPQNSSDIQSNSQNNGLRYKW